MGAALKIVDETPAGEVIRETTLTLASETITVRELIERRVREEVQAFNEKKAGQIFHGLVQPTDAEASLNGYRLRKPRQLDADAQCAKARDAFEKNGFFMLADDRQVESLDEEIVVAADVRISFVKLVPLVGG